MAVILDHARQMPAGGVLVIGDSVAERNRFDTLCGLPALNAGIAWASSDDWLPDAAKVIQAARPSIVILSIGSNDLDADYSALVKATGADFAIAPRNADAARRLAATLPTMPAPSSYEDDKHPDAKGMQQWRNSVETGCRNKKIPTRHN